MAKSFGTIVTISNEGNEMNKRSGFEVKTDEWTQRTE